MPYFTLIEAVKHVTARTGRQMEPSDVLRAGVAGMLPLCAPFGFGRMHNATGRAAMSSMLCVPANSSPCVPFQMKQAKDPDDFQAALLVIPPAHLMEIETEGSAMIQVAFGLDKTMYFPMMTLTLDKLRVLVLHLDAFISSIEPAQKDTPASGTKAAPAAKGRDWREFAREIADECFDNDTNGIPPTRDCLIRPNKRGDIVGGYAFRVMEIMQKRGIHGPRGLITNAATVSREALQGPKWWGKKPK